MKIKKTEGMSLMELLVCVAIISVFISAVIPGFAGIMAKARLKNTSRSILFLFQRVRIQAISEARYIGVRFENSEDGKGICYSIYQDGDGDGLRTADIEAGIDKRVEGPRHFHMEGVEFGILEGKVKDVPTSGGTINNSDDPIKFGRSNIVSFSPIGRSSSGSVYLKSGNSYMFTIKLYGASAKMKEWEYNSTTEDWS